MTEVKPVLTQVIDSPLQAPPPSPKPFDPWRVLTLSEALSEEVSEPPWRVRGLVAEQAGTLISAHPHGMKSLAWLQAAMESVTLGKVWGHFDAINVKRTLFIETEDPHWLVMQRVQQLAKGLEITAEQADECGFHVGSLGPFDLVGTQEKLSKLLEFYKPDFTVLSTLQGLLGGRDWKAQNEMADVNALLVQISRTISPLVVITHSPWNKSELRAAGTITQTANFMTTCHFEKHEKKKERYATVRVDSKLGTEETKFRLRLTTEGTEVRKLIYEQDEAPKKTDVVALIKAHPDKSTAAIADMAGVSDRYVRKIKAHE